MPKTESEIEDLTDLLADCYDDPDLFNTAILQRSDSKGNPTNYWWRQVEICDAIVKHPVTAVESGNAIGKDYLFGGLVPWWLYCRPDSLLIATGPSQTLLGSVTWKEVTRAISRCPFVEQFPEIFKYDLTGGIKTSPHTMRLEPGWQALAFSTASIERASGQHAENLLVLVTEASGLDQEIGEALDSLKATKMVLFGNPIRPEGWFVDWCNQADEDAKNGMPDHLAAKHFVIPSTDSPHATWEKSPYGLADKTWIDGMARRYGKDSLWYRAHVLAIRPKLAHERLLQPEWLDRCISDESARRAAVLRQHSGGGVRRISCDVGEGVGNARSVVVVRDDLGILDITASVFHSPSDTAQHIATLAERWRVRPEHVSYDGAGMTGKRLGNALSGKGYVGARAYFGSHSGGKRCANMRTAAALAFARRVDPDHWTGNREQQEPFHIPASEHWPSIREELLELKYELKGDKSALEHKEDMMERLGRSPDFADAITQAFREEAVRG